MSQTPYTVTVVLDRDYGERLSQIPSGQPVWIVDTPANRAAAENAWAQHSGTNHLTGVTTFKVGEYQSAEETFLGEFGSIDLHHGSYSAQPPYTVVNVIGVQLSHAIKSALSEYGFNEFHATGAGFRAVR